MRNDRHIRLRLTTIIGWIELAGWQRPIKHVSLGNERTKAMAGIIRIEDLKSQEIAELLEVGGRRLCDSQAQAALETAAEISNIKQAFDVMEQLAERKQAA